MTAVSMIQRKLIALELSDRMPILVNMLNQEMDESKIIYSKQMNRYFGLKNTLLTLFGINFTTHPFLVSNLDNSICLFYRIQSKGKATVDRNMPVMSGRLRWASELKGKIHLV